VASHCESRPDRLPSIAGTPSVISTLHVRMLPIDSRYLPDEIKSLYDNVMSLHAQLTHKIDTRMDSDEVISCK
jgi:hypothetical protein